jgi:hypothetical protein
MTAAAIAVPLCVLPSAAWRLSHVFEVLVHGPGPCDTGGNGQLLYLVGLSVVSMTAACLTIGLVRPWGEVVPTWLTLVGGRVVPARPVTVIATLGATLLTLIITYYFVVQAVASDFTFEPVPAGCSSPGIDILIFYLPLIAWPPLLYLVTYHYHRRRTAAEHSSRPEGMQR